MDCQSCKWSGRMGEEQELVCRRYPPRQVEIGPGQLWPRWIGAASSKSDNHNRGYATLVNNLQAVCTG